MRGWALRLVLSLVPGEEARGVFEKWLFLPFVGWFFFLEWLSLRLPHGTAAPPPPPSPPPPPARSDGRRALLTGRSWRVGKPPQKGDRAAG